MTHLPVLPDFDPLEDPTDAPIVSSRDLLEIARLIEPFAEAHAKGHGAYEAVRLSLPILNATGVTKLLNPMAPVAVSIAQGHVSWYNWENIGVAYERIRKELVRRREAAEPKSSIVEPDT